VLAPLAVSATLLPAKMLAELGDILIVGMALLVTGAVTASAVHPPDAGMVYTTVYEPGVLAARFMAPVAALIERPALLEYVPPVEPVNVTVAVPSFEQ